jgi:hypothetical protein
MLWSEKKSQTLSLSVSSANALFTSLLSAWSATLGSVSNACLSGQKQASAVVRAASNHLDQGLNFTENYLMSSKNWSSSAKIAKKQEKQKEML